MGITAALRTCKWASDGLIKAEDRTRHRMSALSHRSPIVCTGRMRHAGRCQLDDVQMIAIIIYRSQAFDISQAFSPL